MTTSQRSSTVHDRRMVAGGLTLGVMARPPVPGRCKTRLANGIGADAAAALYEAMLLDTLDGLSRIQARHVLLAAPEDDGAAALSRLAPRGWEVIVQRGTGLGERLANSMRDLWQEGQLVCLLDSDSPTLPLDSIASRLADPRCHDARTAVVGPCEDGGYYLIGANTAEPGLFDDIPWSTALVLDATRARCAALGLALEELPAWFDVDCATDLERLARDVVRDPSLAPRTGAVLASRYPRRGRKP